MTKRQESLLAKAVPVLLVLAGAPAVRGENVFTDDFKGDGETARFVIEAEHYSSRGGSSNEGWWEVDGGSHRFVEGPDDGKDAPTADKLRTGEDAAGEVSESSAKEGRQSEFERSSVDLSGSSRRPRGNFTERGNYMVVAGGSNPGVAPTDIAYNGAFMDYRVAVETPGEYRLYARWFGLDGNHDSLYAFVIGPDGNVLKGAGPEYFIFHQYVGGWRWDSRGVEDKPYASLAGMPDTPIWRITKPGEYGDLSRWNVAEAKQKIDRMIKTEERSRKALGKAAEQLEGALKALGWTAST